MSSVVVLWCRKEGTEKQRGRKRTWRLAFGMVEMIYGMKCVFDLSPYSDTSVEETNPDLCRSAVQTNPLPVSCNW